MRANAAAWHRTVPHLSQGKEALGNKGRGRYFPSGAAALPPTPADLPAPPGSQQAPAARARGDRALPPHPVQAVFLPEAQARYVPGCSGGREPQQPFIRRALGWRSHATSLLAFRRYTHMPLLAFQSNIPKLSPPPARCRCPLPSALLQPGGIKYPPPRRGAFASPAERRFPSHPPAAPGPCTAPSPPI